MQLSKTDTLVLKGVALLLLLSHHLFYKNPGLYNDITIIGNHQLVQTVGVVSKVCVSIFVFLSGYGLTIKYNNANHFDVCQFYWIRIVKLLTNYWLIWLLFMPISLVWLGPSLSEAYGDYVPLKVLMDFFGVINLVGWYGYNPTWWFYSCIIGLYLLFPILRCHMDRQMPLILLISIAMFFIPGGFLQPLRLYLLPFVLGILSSSYGQKYPPSSLRYRTVVAWGGILGLLTVERAYVHDGMFFDHFLATAIIFTYAQLRIPQPVSKVLSFIGKHSMNIFLFHTFIFGLWFSSFIYSTRNPLIIYMLLLVICVLISVVIEMIKKIVGFNRVQGKLLNLYVRQ